MRRIYFSGINGIGMSGIAKILKQQGNIVEGSDLEYKDITKSLEDLGIKVHIGQRVENIENFNADLYVYSTAIKTTNPEYIYAKSKGIKMERRGQVLADIANKFENSIAVAGTHGKTTTSSMLSLCFLPKDPYVVVGGIVPKLNSNSRLGNSSYFVMEADESDNSFLYLYPSYSVITNIEPDHLEHHGNFENLEGSFIKFIEQTKNKVLLSADCPNIKKLDLEKYKEKLIYYSIEKEAQIYAKNIRVVDGLTKYDVVIDGENLGEFSLKVPGLHNVKNSLPVIYLSKFYGIDIDYIKESLKTFTGAKRRYQVIYDEEIKVIDDYAHHPTEIKATIKAARSNEEGELTVVFEPHRYTRTHFFMNDFAKALSLADKIILLPIYAASEDNVLGISSEDLCEKIKEIDKNKEVYVMLPNEVMEYIYSNSKKKDVYIFMGAGTVSKFAYRLVNKIKE